MSTPVRRGRTLRQRLIGFITNATTRLTGAWGILATAQNALLAALATIRPGPSRGANARVRAAVAAFNQALAAFDRAAMSFVERWAATDLPLVYREGAWQILERADRPLSRFGWTARHRDAITTISAQYYADLTSRIREALRRARAFLRAAQDAARDPQSLRVDTAALRRDHPLGTVVYANNARHPVDSWASAAVTWQAVTTANTGAAHTAQDELGTPFVEIRDGAGCGWTSHDDEDKANRTIRTVQDALAHPVAHPNCQRELLPRLDIAGRTDIMSGALL
ncbi:hypothetical protein [Streptomyces sp. NBC_00878]|uniref:hypothetical protein n=1 Tax=Streptomyces sp. NBC_00878 TaxID=2975854 RepID=UPI00225341F1|nr:hypothetical protein [Streptomyces sp. NBC_00878]MCX4911807.1 hypothetical protein [Streptomyces sp. NBC_00878]